MVQNLCQSWPAALKPLLPCSGLCYRMADSSGIHHPGSCVSWLRQDWANGRHCWEIKRIREERTWSHSPPPSGPQETAQQGWCFSIVPAPTAFKQPASAGDPSHRLQELCIQPLPLQPGGGGGGGRVTPSVANLRVASLSSLPSELFQHLFN